MSPLLAAAPNMLRYWKLVAIGLFLLVAAHGQFAKLRAERALERCRGEAAVAALRLDRANQAAQALARDSARRSADQARQLNQARRVNDGQSPLIERLQRSASAPREGAGCAPSDSLRQAEGQL